MAEESAIPGATADTPPHRKRWIPVSLRLFVTILAIVGAGGALWIGIPAYRQHAAIQHFRILGFEFDIESSRTVPDSLVRWIGAQRLEALGRVKRVNLSGLDLADADVAYLKALNGLEWLALNRNPITDSGILHLAAIGTLKALRIEDTQVTDSGLAHLKNLKHLEVLSLKRTPVTGSGVRHLTGLPLLRHLDLTGTLVDDTAFADLKGLNRVRELRLRETLISDDGLSHLRALTTLNRVELGDLDVSPTAVANLEAAIPGLDVFYEWNFTLQNVNGEPTLDTNWVEIVFEGGKFTSEASGTFPVSGCVDPGRFPTRATGCTWTFYMGGLREQKYSAEFKWTYDGGSAVVDFVAASRDDLMTRMQWRARFTDCGRTLTCRGQTLRLASDRPTVVLGHDGTVRVNGWPVRPKSPRDE